MLKIYEYLLDGYNNNHNKYYTSELSESENDCEKIIYKENESESKIRSCDLLKGKLVNKPGEVETNFKKKFKIDNITSDDLINFMSKNPAKEKERKKLSGLDLYNTTDLINKIINIFKKDWININNDNDDKTLIKYIDGANQHFIIIGDIHGSFATFVRILLRLRIKDILNERCELKQNHNIIFLGDLVDRGVYGYEIVILIYKLKLINPNNIYINRGNHEEDSINCCHGLQDQMKIQFQDNNSLYNQLNLSFNYCHSAILIKNPTSNKYIYLAHGGLPLNSDGSLLGTELSSVPNKVGSHIPNNWIKSENVIINNNEIRRNEGPNSIRWSDFNNQDDTYQLNMGRGGNSFIIGTQILEQIKPKIELIIRGHQDRISNTKILSKTTTNETYESYKSFQNINTEPTLSSGELKCKGFTHKLIIKDDKIFIDNTVYDDLLPVVVLSTNTDHGRDLYHDSYAILSFDNINQDRNCYKIDYPKPVNSEPINSEPIKSEPIKSEPIKPESDNPKPNNRILEIVQNILKLIKSNDHEHKNKYIKYKKKYLKLKNNKL